VSRSKGRLFTNEVKSILEADGHIVDGMFYKSAWFAGRIHAVDTDIFGIADLLSYHDGIIYLHQVTDVGNKARHVKLITDKGIPVKLWCRTKEGRKVCYRVFNVSSNGFVEEEEPRCKVIHAQSAKVKQ
jgi:hypothetical protein